MYPPLDIPETKTRSTSTLSSFSSCSNTAFKKETSSFPEPSKSQQDPAFQLFFCLSPALPSG